MQNQQHSTTTNKTDLVKKYYLLLKTVNKKAFRIETLFRN